MLAAAAGAVAGLGCAPSGALGQTSYEVVYQSGNFLPSVGVITSPFRNSMQGFRNAAINNSGQMWVHVGMIGQPGFDEALLFTDTGFVPFLVEGNDGFVLGAPSADHVVDEIHAVGTNNLGVGGFAFTTEIVEFPFDPLAEPTSGVFLGSGAMLIDEGDPAGFDAGSVWAPMSAAGGANEVTVLVNDANQWLVGHRVIGAGGSGATRRVIVRVQSDASGANLGETLIAEEGGLVAGGAPGEVWEELSVAPHAVAMNQMGEVVFTGRTSAGREGVFLNGAFVALTGGAAPGAPGQVWGSLLGAAVDVNNVGDFVVRGIVESDGTWTEGAGTGADAGEDASMAFEGDREITGGGGALTLISGSLADDHDVDVYRITITDPASFSATTVGGPMEFDSVLWLLQTGHNFNGIDRTGLGRNDDPPSPPAATRLSTLGATNAPGAGTYYLCVSTGKARAVAENTFVNDFARGELVQHDLWQRDPSSLALDAAGGTLYFADPSEGQLRAVTIATGTEGAALQVAATPTVPELTGAEIVSPVAFLEDGANSRVVFWADSDTSADGDGIRAVSRDGATVENVVMDASSPSGLAVDHGRGKVYWARRRFGQLWRANLDGSGAEALIGAVGSGAALELEQTDVVTPVAIAVDEATGDVYAADPHRGAIVRIELPEPGGVVSPVVTDFVSSVPGAGGCACELDGSAGVDVFDLLAFLDLWFAGDAGADLDGAAGVDVFDLLFFLDCWFPASAGAPCGGGGPGGPVMAAGVAIDQVAREVYFTHPSDERVLKAALTGAMAGEAVEVVAGAGAAAHAIAVDGAAGKVYWTEIDERKIYSANLDGSGAAVFFDIGPETADSTADGDLAKRTSFSFWAKRGAASGPALPYEVRLTGASYALEGAMIAKNNATKVAAFGDLLNVPVVVDPNTNPPTTMLVPTRVNYISRTGQPVRISDGGDVLWLGEWGGFGFTEGVFLNQTVTLTSEVNPPDITSLVITGINSGARALDFSDNGRWATVGVTDGRFVGGDQAQVRIDFGP